MNSNKTKELWINSKIILHINENNESIETVEQLAYLGCFVMVEEYKYIDEHQVSYI